MNHCHYLSNCDCFIFNIANAIGGYIDYVNFFSLLVAALLSAFLCLRMNVQIPLLPYACSCTRK